MLTEREHRIYTRLSTLRNVAIFDANRAIDTNDRSRYEQARYDYTGFDSIIKREFADLDAFILEEAHIDNTFPEWPHDTKAEVRVNEDEFADMVLDIALEMDLTADLAKKAVENENMPSYLDLKTEFNFLRKQLERALIRDRFGDWSSVKEAMNRAFPAWTYGPHHKEAMKDFDEMSIPFFSSDVETVDVHDKDAVNVPF